MAKKKVKQKNKSTASSGSKPTKLLPTLDYLHPHYLVLAVLDTLVANITATKKIPAPAGSDLWGRLEELKLRNWEKCRTFWAGRTGKQKLLFPFTPDAVGRMYTKFRKWGQDEATAHRDKVEAKGLAYKTQQTAHLRVLPIVKAVMKMFRRNEEEVIIYDPKTAKVIEAAKAGKLKGIDLNTLGAKSDEWTDSLPSKMYVHAEVRRLWVEYTFRQYYIDTFPYTFDGVGTLYKRIRKRYDNEIAAWEDEIEAAYKNYTP